MDKKLFLKILIIFVFLLGFSINKAYCEEIQNTQYFTVEYELGRQSVWNNSIPIYIYITPKSDYNRVEVKFSHSNMIETSYTDKQYFSVNKGQTYKVQGKINPKEIGLHQITINVIAWEYNTNYTSSASAMVQIDENLEITPQDSMYNIMNIVKYLIIGVFILTILIVIAFILKKNSKKIQDWFKPEF